MTLYLAGPISNQKEKNRSSGIQGLAWTWGGEGGSNLDFLNLESGGILFLMWDWLGHFPTEKKRILARASRAWPRPGVPGPGLARTWTTILLVMGGGGTLY